MANLQADTMLVTLRAVFALSKLGYGDLSRDLETSVAALSDEVNNQRTRAEAAERELRELRKAVARG